MITGKILIKNTNKEAIIIKQIKNVYLIKYSDGLTEIKFENEIEKFNIFKKKWRDLKSWLTLIN